MKKFKTKRNFKNIPKEESVEILSIQLIKGKPIDLNKITFNRLTKNNLISSLMKTSNEDQIVWIDYLLNSYPFEVTKKLFINQKASLIFQSFFDTYTKEFNKKQFHQSIKEIVI